MTTTKNTKNTGTTEQAPKAEVVRHNDADKPPYSYANLIAQAISNAKNGSLTLAGIYDWIEATYPFYRGLKTGWRNSIRHNLSLHQCFMKSAKASPDGGKGCLWYINPEYEDLVLSGDLKSNRIPKKKTTLDRKKRKHRENLENERKRLRMEKAEARKVSESTTVVENAIDSADHSPLASGETTPDNPLSPAVFSLDEALPDDTDAMEPGAELDIVLSNLIENDDLSTVGLDSDETDAYWGLVTPASTTGEAEHDFLSKSPMDNDLTAGIDEEVIETDNFNNDMSESPFAAWPVDLAF
eukprot:Clim_evm1s191 gene=Clim_evmTU1s191